jgi:hypothetical protein
MPEGVPGLRRHGTGRRAGAWTARACPLWSPCDRCHAGSAPGTPAPRQSPGSSPSSPSAYRFRRFPFGLVGGSGLSCWALSIMDSAFATEVPRYCASSPALCTQAGLLASLLHERRGDEPVAPRRLRHCVISTGGRPSQVEHAVQEGQEGGRSGRSRVGDRRRHALLYAAWVGAHSL